MDKPEELHKGHRERIRARFEQGGLEGFSDVEALELLLTYAIPRRDTNELAHRLLNRFRDLRGVLEAKTEDLVTVPGVGENAARLVSLTRELNRRYLAADRRLSKRLSSTAEVGEYLQPSFRYRTEEVFVLLCLDSASRVLSCRVMAQGSAAGVSIPFREMVDTALRDKAARVVIAHNHLSGTALPSRADVTVTRQMRELLRMIEVELADHLVFSEDDYVSMRESGYLDEM